jgi:FkbM family methyltransferase
MTYSIFDYSTVSDDQYIDFCNSTLRSKGITNELFHAVNDGECRYKICRHTDGIERYFSYRLQSHGFTDGIDAVAKNIHKAYHLEIVPIRDQDIIIDVGANTGDLQLCLRLMGNRCTYVGIEPGVVEFSCLKRNANSENDLVLNCALGPQEGKAEFFVSSESGDSSLIMPKNYSRSTMVRVLTLETIVGRLRAIFPLKTFGLLKLEAEGYEPEILAGGLGVIQMFEYVSADLGWERGVSEETTAPEVINLLLESGFKIVAMGRKRMTVLFRNTNSPRSAT